MKLQKEVQAQRAKRQFDEFVRSGGAEKRGNLLRFAGVDGHDIYNPSIPFELEGKVIMAARVEPRSSEVSRTMFFEQAGEVWRLIEDAPVLDLQDPFIAFISGELWVGGVRAIWEDDGKRLIEYATHFFRGTSLRTLAFALAGPRMMKDVRLLQLPNGRIAIFSRPQGAESMRRDYGLDCVARIGFTIVDSVAGVTAEAIAGAPLLDGQFTSDEWGGTNQLYPLKNGLIGVVGHKAWGRQEGEVFVIHYYSMAFALNPATRELTQTKIIGARCCYPDGPQKNARTADVTFTSGIVRLGGGRARLYSGLNDCQVGMMEIADPLDEYEEIAL